MRTELESGLKQLSDMETQMFGVRHRTTNRPLDTTGKTYTPMTARGRRHVPVAALPFDARGRRYIPSPREIVENAAFRKYADKGNIEMALAKLAAINPRKYGWLVRNEAKIHPRVRRARNRVGSDVEIGWPPKNDEALVLDNFYATKLLERPLMGVAYDEAVRMLNGESASRGKTLAEKLEGENEITPFRYQFGGKPLKGDPERKMNVGRYRRILKKFFLPS